jgi:hypothetical protein
MRSDSGLAGMGLCCGISSVKSMAVAFAVARALPMPTADSLLVGKPNPFAKRGSQSQPSAVAAPLPRRPEGSPINQTWRQQGIACGSSWYAEFAFQLPNHIGDEVVKPPADAIGKLLYFGEPIGELRIQVPPRAEQQVGQFFQC